VDSLALNPPYNTGKRHKLKKKSGKWGGVSEVRKWRELHK